MSTNLSTTLALSTAALFLSACAGSKADTAAPGSSEANAGANIKCMGINECAQQGACETATHSCAGQNECKGKGWVLASQSDCDAKGGTPKA